MKINVAIIVSQGIAWRNISQTDFLKSLIQEDFQPHIFCHEDFKKFVEDDQSQHAQMEKPSIFQQILISALKRRFSFVRQTVSNKLLRKDPLYKSFKSRVLSLTAYPFPNSEKIYNFLLHSLKTLSIKRSELTGIDEGIKQFDLVISLNPTSGDELNYLFSAKKNNIPIWAFVKSIDNISTKGFMPIVPDALFVWNEKMKMEALDCYDIHPKNIHIIGAPHFNNSVSNSMKNLNSQTGKCLLYASVAEALNPSDINIVKFISTNVLSERDQLIVRLHQNDKMARWENHDLKDNVVIFNPSEHKASSLRVIDKNFLSNLHQQIVQCDVVINTASTMTLEALSFKRPVININFNLGQHSNNISRFYHFTHYKYLLNSSNVYLASTAEELEKLLKDQSTYKWNEEEEFLKLALGPVNTNELFKNHLKNFKNACNSNHTNI